MHTAHGKSAAIHRDVRGLLALGLVLFLFVHPATQHGLDALHAIVGVCLGMSGAFGALAVTLRVRGNGRN